ncbi:GIY-YIG nuclease family protein [Streptomyces sp. NPDC004629]|uniref:GIY-YIG nuclease family protein n=1 Tax=Streptomyces sp. NPDC004629 TaxID=3364705 RepID=UPI00368A3712
MPLSAWRKARRTFAASSGLPTAEFEVHALIFSKDAVSLKTELHRQFAARRVNHQLSSRKEFF